MQPLPILFSQVISLVSNPPGSLVYHLVLLFAFQAAAAIAFGQWRKGGAEARLFWVAAGLFVVRLVLLVAALLVAAAIVPPLAVIPPLDRAASTLTILLIVWAFAFPKSSRPADAIMGALALFTLIALAISWGLWIQTIPPLGTTQAYNGSAQESVWEISQLALLLAGGVLLAVRRGAAWYIGLILLFLLLVVHGLQLFLPLSGNVPGLVRLVEIVALPMFTWLVYQRANMPLSPLASASPPLQLPASTALSPSAVNSRALVALASLHGTAELGQRRQNLTLALGYLFQADLSLLILPPDKAGDAAVACCYRVSRGQFSSRPDLTLNEFPAVAAAFKSDKATLLTVDEHEVELRRLAAGTGLEGVGFGLSAPLALSSDYPVGVVVLLASAARPAWTVEDQNLLGTLARSLAAVFDTADQLAALRDESKAQQSRADAAEEQRGVVQETAEKLMGELAQAQTVVLQLTAQLNQAQRAAQSHTPERAALGRETEVEQQRHEEARNRLEVELEAAQEGLVALALLQSQFKSLSEETEGLRQAKASLEKEAEQLRGDLQSAEAQVQVFATSDHALESEAQSQQTAQLRLELELARMELQGVAERRSALLVQMEKERQGLAETTRVSLAPIQAELEEKKALLQQLAEGRDQREAELTSELERARAELEKAGESTQTLIQDVHAALTEKEASLQQLAEHQQQREAAAAAQLTSLTAELEQARAELQQAAAQVGSLTAELERARAELQQAVGQVESLTQAGQQGQALLAEAQAALADRLAELRQLTEEHEAREAEGILALEQTRAELQQALERQSALEKFGQDQQAQFQEAQAALATARAAIAGQAATFVATHEKLVDKERELLEALSNLQTARQSEMSPAAQTTLEQVATLAQDLRQPVMSISGYVSLLLGESVGLVGAVQRKFLERIQAACERLEVLLNDLSQASEAAFGARPLAMASVNVTTLMEEALQDNEALLREKGIHLRLELAENLPMVYADAAALRRVFSGLIHNAASATSLNGEVRLVVRRETQNSREDGCTDCIFISVKDSGSGLTSQDLPRVFSSASRSEAPLAGLGDAGRDLAALQPLVEAHRGRIWVTSEPGQGSLFSVLLPMTSIPTPSVKNESPAGAVEPPLSMPKALDFLVLPPD